jgi:hypothetical protein
VEIILRDIMVSRFTSGGYLEVYIMVSRSTCGAFLEVHCISWCQGLLVEGVLRYTMVDCQGLLVEIVLRYIMVSRFTVVVVLRYIMVLRFTCGGFLEVYL